MRIVCPGCAATYDVPDARLAPGRTVRCARCGTDWPPLPEPSDDAPVPHEPPAPDLTPPDLAAPDVAVAETHAAPDAPPDIASDPAPDAALNPATPLAADPAPVPFPPLALAATWPGRGAVAAAWIASLVLLGGLAWGAYAGRTAIMQAWPPSERLYAALGLAG